MTSTTLAKCAKCGRGFITLPKPGATDPFFPANQRVPKDGWGDGDECGGKIELTDAGRDLQKSETKR